MLKKARIYIQVIPLKKESFPANNCVQILIQSTILTQSKSKPNPKINLNKSQ